MNDCQGNRFNSDQSRIGLGGMGHPAALRNWDMSVDQRVEKIMSRDFVIAISINQER